MSSKLFKVLMAMALLSVIIAPTMAFANRSDKTVTTVSSSPQGEVPNPNCGDQPIPKRPHHPIKVVVNADCRVFGDVQVGPVGRHGYTIFPDSDPNSGMIVDCVTRCKVLFHYGGGVTGQLIGHIGLDMMGHDQCKHGCDRVDLRFFLGG